MKALLRVAADEAPATLHGAFSPTRTRAFGKKSVAPKSPNQKKYIEALETHDMVFAIGPGGTGKTYLAVAMAVSALLSKQVNRIILARPAVEAGERLGFLPGTLQEKVDPYMRPLYDALHDLLEADKLERFLEKDIIEVAPLAFMRGRTLNDSFVILDEAQNTTSEQMKMFLTRLGFNSKAVITGDVTQIDLPDGRRSGWSRPSTSLARSRASRCAISTSATWCATAWCSASSRPTTNTAGNSRGVTPAAGSGGADAAPRENPSRD